MEQKNDIDTWYSDMSTTPTVPSPAVPSATTGLMGGPTVPMMTKMAHILGLASDIPIEAADAVAMFTTENVIYQPSTNTHTTEYVGFRAPDQFSWIPAATKSS